MESPGTETASQQTLFHCRTLLAVYVQSPMVQSDDTDKPDRLSSRYVFVDGFVGVVGVVGFVGARLTPYPLTRTTPTTTACQSVYFSRRRVPSRDVVKQPF